VLIVPNALSWPRDILVTAKAPKAGKGQRVRDLAHGHVVVSQPDNDGVAFIAKNVPPLGYRAFRLEAEALRQPAALLKQGKDTYHWQTQDFRFVIDPHTGAIAQLEDLRLKRDWVEEHSGYGLNQYLYVPGGEKTGLIHPGVKPPESLSILTHSVAHVELLENGPVRAVLLVRRTGDQVDDTDSYIILEPGRRLDFVNVLHKKATTAKEAGYFAFPFRLSRPDEARAYVELPYGIVEADREQQPGACRDWYSTNSFVAVTDGQVTACLVTPQAPLVSIGDIVRGTWRGKIEAPRNRLFAYVFNNYWHTNYKASQGGDMLFAFSVRLTAGGFDPVDATHFGWERLASMLDPGTASKPDFWRRGDTEGLFSDAVSEPQDSFLQLKGDPVVVGGLTRENDNLLVRLYNPASRTAEAKLFLRNCSGGSQTDLFGKQEHPLQSARNGLKVTVPPRSFITVAPTAKKTQ
jgi:hypothetical protein